MKLKLFALFILLVACTASPVAPIPTHTSVPTSTVEFIHTPTLSIQDSLGRTEWNFLVLGSDFRENDPLRSNPHTDAFILVNVREADNTLRVTFMPIARELWVNDGLLLNVYRDYGFDGTANLVEDTFGLKLSAIFYADMENFANFVDSIGGVKMNVPYAVDDVCGNRVYRFEQGQREVFGGYDLLCLARMRKGYTDGYFSRQVVHTEILKAMWDKLVLQVGTDPMNLVNAAVSHPFIQVWPIVEWMDLGKLAIRASLSEVEYRTVSLGKDETINAQEFGPLADGTQGYFYVRHAAVDLKLWVQEALNGYGN